MNALLREVAAKHKIDVSSLNTLRGGPRATRPLRWHAHLNKGTAGR
jgi:hypothetical protein